MSDAQSAIVRVTLDLTVFQTLEHLGRVLRPQAGS